ncbi:hypothetical protein [Streptomyces alanosinicus]|uniref:Syndecan 1 n=1 Tax=Streptomyces alanosinicus TaxID=68171 RepID=A0A919D391_9ACTN|nr:hypothetical protein [Streptomyces alanosinicus]GHE05148.1 hypothetical protein GCM10010339_39720 [Streptomyces alanosinicus]
MAWRDRLRRRATAPGAGGTPAGPGSAQPAVQRAMSTPASGAAGPSVPQDWDGGWRRTRPPMLTVSRAPLGVSDGLSFRSGLASWQNPSFDAGLGHALLPSAPVGLVRGVTGPATPRATHTAGGPLLLRVPSPQAEEAVEAGPRAGEPAQTRPDTAGTQQRAAAPVRQVSRRARPGAGPHDTGGRPDSGSPQRAGTDTPSPAGPAATDPRPAPPGTGSGASGGTPASAPSGRAGQSGPAVPPAVQRSAETSPGRALVAADPLVTVTAPDAPVQRSTAEPGRPAPGPELPVVRRIAVVPHSAGHAPAPRTPSGPGTTPPPRPDRTAPHGQATTVATERAASATPARDASAAPARDVSASPAPVARTISARSVRPRPLSPSLTVARRPATPLRRIAALRPEPEPTAARPADRPLSGPDAVPAVVAPAPSNPAPAVQRTADPAHPDTRAPLGAPLPELPATARPLTTGGPGTTAPATAAHPADAPTLPMVQRQASAPGTDATPGPYVSNPATPQNRLRREPRPQIQTRPAPQAQPQTRAQTRAQAQGEAQTETTGTTGTSPGTPPVPGPSGPPTRPQPSGARVRGGLGAPLSAMPPTAEASPSTGPRGATGRPAGGGAEALPHVQRAHVRPDHTVTSPPATASNAQPPAAPLLGTTHSASGGGNPNSPAVQGISLPAPSAPVQRAGAPEPPAPSTGASASPSGAGTGVGGPGPLVVTRPVTLAQPGTGTGTDSPDAGTPGVIQRRTLTAQGQRSAPRTLALLAARPLAVNTRVPEGVAPPSATRAAERPVVVAASWRRAPDPVVNASAPSPEPGPAAEVPHVQRSAAGPVPSGPADSPAGTAGSPETRRTVPGARPTTSDRRAVPVVRPAPSVQRAATGGDMAVRPHTLPLSDPQAPALPDHPYGPAAATPPVPVVRATRTAPTAPAAAPRGAAGSTGPAVQRETTRAGGGAVPGGVPVRAVPARGRPRSASEPPAPGTAGARGTGSAGAPQEPVVDLDELARRLVDPLARLLRADLRRGRERAGRPYDGRR